MLSLLLEGEFVKIKRPDISGYIGSKRDTSRVGGNNPTSISSQQKLARERKNNKGKNHH